MPSPPPPELEPVTLGGELRSLARALYRAAGQLLIVVISLAVIVAGIAVIAAPGVAALWICVCWVLDLPGGVGRPYYPTAFAGLFVGGYLLIASIGSGSLSRRLSARVARLRPARAAAVERGAWIGLAGHVAGGRPIEPKPEEGGEQGGEPAPPQVGYPLLIQDDDGELVRVERWDGGPTPADPASDGWTGPVFRVGQPVFAVGVLQRIEGVGGYRGAGPSWRLWRGTPAVESEPLFRVREGTQADLVRELQSYETSRWWGIASIALLVMGAASVWLAQPRG